MAGSNSQASMNAALRAQCLRIQELLRKAAADEVEARYEIGAIVVRVQNDESKYDRHAVAQLAEEVGYSAPTLYHYAAVARQWSAAEMRELRGRVNGYGEPLLWGHWTELTRVPKTWRRWCDAALAESWSTLRLARELDALSRPTGSSDVDAEDTTRAALMEAIKEAQRSSTTVGAFAAALDRLGRENRHPAEIRALLARALDLFGDVHRKTGEVVARARSLAPPEPGTSRKQVEN
jgi:hypothetical protein